ncbi:MAG: indolepyruvate ferredoxin oxidoreductase subunit alpha [Deltaproteobacteria bacterium]|nr:indolepyruvate ferredoxin oxidoreductase subunit alpha [Deltaproteobacteria bacterium]
MSELLADQPGERRLFLGNEAIVRGALEAGVRLAATYPGTPASEIGDRLYVVSRQTDLYFEYSTNEKVALEVAAGAAASGWRALCSMKHVGLNVAADALMTLGYVGVKAGMVIVSADDPSLFSSQNEQDNRYYAKLAGLPMLEPASPQEAKDMTRAAFELSEELGLPVMLRTTTRINHTRGAVTLGPLPSAPGKAGRFQKDPFNLVMVPAVARKAHARLVEKYDRAREQAEASRFNTITGEGPWGIAASGVAAAYVQDALLELGLKDKVTFLKLGFTHPLPAKLVGEFLARVEKVLVVEELEPFLEEHIKAVAQESGLTLPIHGKGRELFSRLYEYDPALVRGVVARYFGVPDEPGKALAPAGIFGQPLPDRPPNLCPGCPHRAMYYAVKIALQELGVEGIFPTDIGCYTLGLLPPLSMADFLICMGSSITTACGIARATGRKVVAFIGDSTFFHAGLTGLANAVHNNHDVLLIILDNGTTAMTGHQPHPGVTLTPPDYPGRPIDIAGVVKALGVEQSRVVNPFKYKESLAATKEAIAARGVRVLISQAPCHLYVQRIKGKKSKARFQVVDACGDCRHCLDYFGCPAMYVKPDAGVSQMFIDHDLCAGCAFCVQFCECIRPVKGSAR